MESLFIHLMYKSQFKKMTLMTGFVVQGHILEFDPIFFKSYFKICDKI